MQSSSIIVGKNLKMHRSQNNNTKVVINANNGDVITCNNIGIITNVGISSSGNGDDIGGIVGGVSSVINNVTDSNINTNSTGGPLDTLPKQFVTSMKTLFDILDDQKTGFVKLSDIEKGWQDDGCKGLPHGVIDSLRKVTPANGLLSFERFCAGLKICLLRNQTEHNKSHRTRQSTINTTIISGNPIKTVIQSQTAETPKIKPSRPPSAPLLDIENPIPNAQWSTSATSVATTTTTNNTATVRPNNVVQAQRALSLPQLSPGSDLEIICDTMMPDLYGPPPKPPRSSIVASSGTGTAIDKAEIRHALQNWQMGILMNEMDAKDKRKANSQFSINRFARGTADGGTATETGPISIQSSQSATTTQTNSLFQKKPNIKRREPRRHTLQNGVDYTMLKRLKQFEKERDVLLQGLAAVEKAREWYLKQISNTQEKIKYLGRMGSHTEQWSEAHQERLDLQRARILELNRHLSALTDSCRDRSGYPLHINLAVRHGIYQSAIQSSNNNASNNNTAATTTTIAADQIQRLKQKNHQLTDEISQKSERITILEREKQSLIHELVQFQRSCDLIGMTNSPSSNTNGTLIESSDVPF